jgi:triacylglycerol lipase
MAAEDLKAALLEGGSTASSAVGFLQLCQVSYLPASAIPVAVRRLPPLNAGGSWQCAWGPAQSSDQSNLAFVATYYYGPGLPVFAATVIRGTDTDVSDGWGIIEQLWQDLDVIFWEPLPWEPNHPARVACGTLDALTKIQGLISGGRTLQNFLTGFLGDPANGQPLAVVTGHSLGGCLTTVVAPWLKYALAQSGIRNPIVPASFAGPTAGNPAFARYYDSQFNSGARFYNTLDVAPCGWGQLPAVETIYQPCGLDIPDIPYLAIAVWEGAMYRFGVEYAQPATNNAPLTGTCYATNNWYDELAYQHHTTTYMTLLGGTSVHSEVMPLQSTVRARSLRSTLYERFGTSAGLLAARRPQ